MVRIAELFGFDRPAEDDPWWSRIFLPAPRQRPAHWTTKPVPHKPVGSTETVDAYLARLIPGQSSMEDLLQPLRVRPAHWSNDDMIKFHQVAILNAFRAMGRDQIGAREEDNRKVDLAPRD